MISDCLCCILLSTQPSKDRSSDGNDADEELPFAWADSEMMGHTVAAPAIAADSVGAPLLYGLSKLSIHPGAVHRGMGGGAGLVGAPTQRNQSTYTGAVRITCLGFSEL